MKLKRLFIGVLLISISSLLYFDILISDFRVTFAIVAMGAFLCLYRKSDPILVGVIVAFTTFFLRLGLHMIETGEVSQSAGAFMPEMAFYVLYGIIIRFTIYRRDLFRSEDIFVVALFGDFFSNVLEVSLRVAFFDQVYTASVFLTLFIVAMIRALILLAILKIMKFYRMLLIREDHEMRYQRLIHMTMLLKDEMYWFEKNKVRIESSMAKAYRLFEQLNHSGEPSLASDSLAIAGDIHEIKKEYELVLRGFKQITEVEYEISKMQFSDMLKILEKTLSYMTIGRNLTIEFRTTDDFSTSNHFELMSILRNLISNSIDAVGQKGRIRVRQFKLGSVHHFIVEDDGRGIPENLREEIFAPGYSTKIDYETGEINRGLGLSLVKALVETHFGGKITVQSEPGKSTRFEIEIEESELEG